MPQPKKSLCLILSLTVLLVTCPVNIFALQRSPDPEDNRVAILDLEGTGFSQLEVEALTNFMRQELELTGSAISVDPQQIEEGLTRLGQAETGCSSTDCAVEIGRILNIPRVVLGSVSREGQNYTMVCRLLNVETGAAEKSVSRAYEGDVDGLIVALQRLVWEILELAPPAGRFPEETFVRALSSLTFTRNNWNVPQEVVIYGVDDDVDDGDQTFAIVPGAIVSEDTGYAGLELSSLAAVNIDDDRAGIRLFPDGSLTTTEGGGEGHFSISLTSEPLSAVRIVAISSDTTEGEVFPSALDFDAGNWRTPRSLTVSGKDDFLDDGDQTYTVLIQPAISADSLYQGIDLNDISVTNLDNDRTGIEVHPAGGLVTTETGLAARFSVRLTSQPVADVTVSMTSSDTTEGIVSPGTVTFSPGDWTFPRTVTVTGVEDEDITDQDFTVILHPATSMDLNYHGWDAKDVTVRNRDRRPGVAVFPVQGLTVDEEGTDTSFSVVLTAEPADDVTLTFLSLDSTEAVVLPPPVTFTPGNWNEVQKITVSGVDDSVDDGDHNVQIVGKTAVSPDPNYAGLVPERISVLTRDDDDAAIVVSTPEEAVTTEGGDSTTFTVSLATRPLMDVTLEVVSSDTGEGRVSPSSLTFSPGDWNVPRTVTVRGADDDVDDGRTAYRIGVGETVRTYDALYATVEAKFIPMVNEDDDEKGISVTPDSLVTAESGMQDSFQVVLTSRPLDGVTLQISLSDSSEEVVSVPPVTIEPGSWNLPRTVRITGVDDRMDDGDRTSTIFIRSISPGDPNYHHLEGPDVTVSNLDDDTSGVTIIPVRNRVTTEAGLSTPFLVRLTSQPSSPVSIPLESSDESEGKVSLTPLTFTGETWDTPQAVNVVGVDDTLDDGDQSYSIVLGKPVSADRNYSKLEPREIPLRNLDDDGPGIAVRPVENLVTTESGHSIALSLTLTEKPVAGVSIRVSSSDTSEGRVSPPSVTFDVDRWNVPRIVTVTGVDDTLDDGDRPYTLDIGPATSGDPAYEGVETRSVEVTNKDDDGPGILVYPTSGLTTAEWGKADTFLVVLTSEPDATVTLKVGTSDEFEGRVSPSVLKFRGAGLFGRANWHIPHVVTVRGSDDDVDDGDRHYTIRVEPAVSADERYNGMVPDDVLAVNLDDDTAAIVIEPSGELITSEEGKEASFSITLTSRPRDPVTLWLHSSDTTEGRVSPSPVVLNDVNWLSGQEVVVAGVDDPRKDGDQAFEIVVDSVTTEDAHYLRMKPGSIPVVNRDDDESGITLSPTGSLVTTEKGGIDSFSVALTSQPYDDIVLVLTSSDTSEGYVSPSRLIFHPGTWNMPRTVSVKGVDDPFDDGDQPYSVITGTVTSGDTAYSGLDPADVTVMNVDDDTAGVEVIASAGATTTEAGGTAVFTVALTAEPAADVSFSIQTSDSTAGLPSPSLLTFSRANWNSPRAVTVTGVDDTVAGGNRPYIITIAPAVSEDSLYRGRDPGDLTLMNQDNDGPGALVYPTGGLTTAESGDSSAFEIVLTSRPEGEVVFSLKSSNPREGTVSPSLVTFGPDNWATPKRVTVTGKDDSVDDGDRPYTVRVEPAVSSDLLYAGFDPVDVSVINRDDDRAGIILSSRDEIITGEPDRAASLSIGLTSEPVAEVTIPLRTSEETEATVFPSSITFSPGNWNSLQEVTVTGVDDPLDDGDRPFSLAIAPARSEDAKYNGVDANDLKGRNMDDDESAVLILPDSGLVTGEGGRTDTVAVVLSAEPAAEVALRFRISDTTEVRARPMSLSFSPDSWNEPQLIVLTGLDDDVDDGNQTYSLVMDTVISGDRNYAAVRVSPISVVNLDDDTAGIRIISPGVMTTTEGGDSDTFRVVLMSEPTADVIVSFEISDETEGSLSPPSLEKGLGEPAVMAAGEKKGIRLGGVLGWVMNNYDILLVAAVVGGSVAALALPPGKGEPTIEKPPVYPEPP